MIFSRSFAYSLSGIAMGLLLLAGALAAHFVGADFYVVMVPALLGLPLVVGGIGGVLWMQSLETSRLETQGLAQTLLDCDETPRILTHENGNVLLANTAARKMFSDQDPMAWLSLRLLGEDPDVAEAFSRLRTSLTLGRPESLDLLVSDDGDVRRLNVILAPIDGPRQAVAWAIHDVTARRTIDDLLMREREELADFLFFLPVGLYSADAEGRLRYVNQTMARWIGDEASSMVGLALANVMDGPPPAPDGAWEGRTRFRPFEATPFDARVIQSTYDEGGDIRTRSVVLRLEGAETAHPPRSDHATARHRLWLFDDAPVGIALTDPEGAITDCNGSFLSLLGETREGVLDHMLPTLALDADRALLSAQADRVMDGQVARARCDVRLKRADGDISVSLFLSRMAARLSDPSDGLLVHLIDTTEQKNLEQQVAQAQKMQAMGQLAGGIAHDFNNLLTAMIGFSELLLQRHGVGDPSFADIMQIRQNANRAANLVRQLLAFSRRQPLRPQLLNVTDALSELSHLLRRLLGEQVTLKLNHARIPCYIRVDPGQFDQVIINLAVNARDAMPPGGGVVTISTKTRNHLSEIRQGAESMPPGDYVMIEVVDTGSGIRREDLVRIFEPFYTTKAEGTAGSGTGLGLSTVYGIIRQTEGYVFVESVLGEGSRFTICLPRHEPPGGDTAPRLPLLARAKRGDGPKTGTQEGQGVVSPAVVVGPVPPRLQSSVPDVYQTGGEPLQAQMDLSGKGTILFVEDEDAVRVFGSRALRNKGYHVLEARSGEGALDVLEREPEIDLLLTDMVMPGMDGATLAAHVCKTRPHLPIILASGYSEDVIQGDIMARPNTYFLPKPFSLNALAMKVRDVLLGETPEAPPPDE